MYTIQFNDHEFKPVPKINMTITNHTTGPGQYLYTEKLITLEGYVSGNCITGTLFEAQKLRKALDYDPDFVKTKSLNIQGGNTKLLNDGQQAIVKSFEFSPHDDQIDQLIDYTIVFSAITYNTGLVSLIKKDVSGYDAPMVSSVTDNYTLEVLQDKKHINMESSGLPAMKLTRRLGAVGVEDGGRPPIWKARKWIKERQEKSPIIDIEEIKYFQLYNHDRQITEDSAGGSFDITDTFLAMPPSWNGALPAALHTYSMDLSQDLSNDLQIITINGTIQGLEPVISNDFIYKNYIDIDNQQTILTKHIQPTVSGLEDTKYNTVAYDNAYQFYTGMVFTGIFWLAKEEKTRLDSILDVSTNLLRYLPTNISESFNHRTASITYSYTYNNRSEPYLSGALVESFSMNNQYKVPTKTHKHSIIGKLGGPSIYYYIGTSGINTKTINYECYLPPMTGLLRYKFAQQVKDEIYTIMTRPISQYLGNADGNNKKGYIESYELNHNLGINKLNAILKFNYVNGCD